MSDANVALTVQAAAYANNLLAKEFNMSSLHKNVAQIQGKMNNLKYKIHPSVTSRNEVTAKVYIKRWYKTHMTWWSAP